MRKQQRSYSYQRSRAKYIILHVGIITTSSIDNPLATSARKSVGAGTPLPHLFHPPLNPCPPLPLPAPAIRALIPAPIPSPPPPRKDMRLHTTNTELAKSSIIDTKYKICSGMALSEEFFNASIKAPTML